MKHVPSHISLYVMFTAAACAAPGENIDTSDLSFDPDDYTSCELDAVVDWLNSGPTSDDIVAEGVGRRGANALVRYRDGADEVFGTDDDDLFDGTLADGTMVEPIIEVDLVRGIGPVTFAQLVAAQAHTCGAFDDLSGYTECELEALVDYLNDGVTSWQMLRDDVPLATADLLVEYRDGDDGVYGTDDDRLFDDETREHGAVHEAIRAGDLNYDTFEDLVLASEHRCNTPISDFSEFDDCARSAVSEFLNRGATVRQLFNAGIDDDVARLLVQHRDGADGEFGTVDDDLFEGDGAELTALQEVANAGRLDAESFDALAEAASVLCDPTYEESHPSVIFSPQFEDPDDETLVDTHLDRTVQYFDAAERSIDFAMYSYYSAAITDALERARARGVTIRAILEIPSGSRTDFEGSRAAQLEDMGIEVRYVNKIMHHKYAIVDGVRDSLDQAEEGVLISGSGNWSNGAASVYDENTVFIEGSAELNLRFQREFNHLWRWSRPVEWNEEIVPITSIDIGEDDIIDSPDVDAVFTSDNFENYVSSRWGNTFRLHERTPECAYGSEEECLAPRDTVAHYIAAQLDNATESVWVASGHLRSRPITDALIRASARGLDVRVYLDSQEYITEGRYASDQERLSNCLAEAGDDEDARADCEEYGNRLGYEASLNGVNVRYKHYSYYWHYTYAPQMHHKYIILDERTVLSGSYNFSANAEHNTLENMIAFSGESNAALVQAFAANFLRLWRTGEDSNEDHDLFSLWSSVPDRGDDFPIVYTPMALDWQRVGEVRSAVFTACPHIGTYYPAGSRNPSRWCSR